MTHRDIWVYFFFLKSSSTRPPEVGAYIPTPPLHFLFSMFQFWNKADGGEPSSAYGWFLSELLSRSYQNALDPHSLSTEVQINCVDICRFLLFIWNWSANLSVFFFFRQIPSSTNEQSLKTARVLPSLWTKQMDEIIWRGGCEVLQNNPIPVTPISQKQRCWCFSSLTSDPLDLHLAPWSFSINILRIFMKRVDVAQFCSAVRSTLGNHGGLF